MTSKRVKAWAVVDRDSAICSHWLGPITLARIYFLRDDAKTHCGLCERVVHVTIIVEES